MMNGDQLPTDHQLHDTLTGMGCTRLQYYASLAPQLMVDSSHLGYKVICCLYNTCHTCMHGACDIY